MRAATDRGGRRAPSAKESAGRRLADVLLGRQVTLLLTAIALLTGLATFAILSGGLVLARRQPVDLVLLGTNTAALLLLVVSLGARVRRVWSDRRLGLAAARLHVRLVVLFSVVAVVPTLVVALFATALFHLGIQAWFNDRVRTALAESLAAARGYLQEHNDAIRSDASNLADDLAGAGASSLVIANPEAVTQILFNQGLLNGFTAAMVFDPITGQVMASMNRGPSALPPPDAVLKARSGGVAVLDSPDHATVSAVIALPAGPDQPLLMLSITRPVDSVILGHMERTEQAVAAYDRLDRNRSGLQVTFVLIFVLVARLGRAAAVMMGLILANQIARPLGTLIVAAERVRTGDLAVRVPERGADDELAGLLRAFNRMTDQLDAQRGELMSAYSQIDERRRFTETVLSGVSAGVIGLDFEGRIELPNRAASELLGTDLLAAVGRDLGETAPAFAPLLAEARHHLDRASVSLIEVDTGNRRRTLTVRIGVEGREDRVYGFVVTFDDITELQSAQRKAAWADVARRIAHEIKNPLTPIQLSAERLKRRFGREISSDPDTFRQCADTIIRHVGDIGRMVDEFSAFARMPAPVIKDEDIGRIAREALILQRDSRPDIEWITTIPPSGPRAPCDRRLVGQALVNLLLNAADAVHARQEGSRDGAGRVEVAVSEAADAVRIAVRDDGVGLPAAEERARLTEPYVTHKPKGTGLGLAIVKKIMEDHGGALMLEDNDHGPGALATLILPARADHGA